VIKTPTHRVQPLSLFSFADLLGGKVRKTL